LFHLSIRPQSASPHPARARAANAYYARGLASSASGDPSAAITDFTNALAQKSEYPDALLGVLRRTTWRIRMH